MRCSIVAAAVIAASPLVAHAQDALPGGIAVGHHAPAAAVQTLDGKPANLKTYLGQQPVVMEFWAKWCGNCRELAPTLKAAKAQYNGRVKFLTVAVSVDQTPADVAAFAAANGLPSPILYDATGAAVDAYDVPGTSFVVVVNRQGTVVYTGAGGTQDIDAAVRKAL
jgi:cytochrome c biogenesis protein CcmG, thiol:disulfide interchange protein DsbE